MKATELIKLLQIAVLRHGDAPIMISDYQLDHPIDIEQLQSITIDTNTTDYIKERVFLVGGNLRPSVIYTVKDIPSEPEPYCPDLIEAFNSKEVTAEIKGVRNASIP